MCGVVRRPAHSHKHGVIVVSTAGEDPTIDVDENEPGDAESNGM